MDNWRLMWLLHLIPRRPHILIHEREPSVAYRLATGWILFTVRRTYRGSHKKRKDLSYLFNNVDSFSFTFLNLVRGSLSLYAHPIAGPLLWSSFTSLFEFVNTPPAHRRTAGASTLQGLRLSASCSGDCSELCVGHVYQLTCLPGLCLHHLRRPIGPCHRSPPRSCSRCGLWLQNLAGDTVWGV